MAADIIDIALSTITDFIGFERLSTEVLQHEGFAKIRPLGLRDDQGIDASVEKFFHNDEVQRTVFQYTTQEYLTGKVKDTIAKLKTNNIDFNELIIATNRLVSPSRQTSIKQEARRDFGVRVDIYEYQTFRARLSDLTNGIFVRHFPDIEKQLTLIKQQGLLLAQPSSEAHEVAMLRVSCALSFHDLSNQARRSVFDSLTLAILSLCENVPVRPDALVQEYSRCVAGLDVQPDQVRASLERLHARGLVSQMVSGYEPSDRAKRDAAATIAALNQATESLLHDILDSVEVMAGVRLSTEDKRQIYANARATLSELFRLSGLDLARQVDESKVFFVADVKQRQDLVALAKDNLPERIGEGVVAVLGDLLSNPEPEQAETLASWCRAFVGAQLMHLDPTLNEFHASRLARKIFVLDTDTVLDAVVIDTPNSAPILRLVRTLLSIGCKVVIPQKVVRECVGHAEHSERTYNYFGQAGASLSAQYLEERVNNVFVKGYFCALQSHTVPTTTSYKEYLSNYFEPSDSVQFFADVLRTIFPDGVTIADTPDLLGGPLPEDMLQKVEGQLLQDLQRSRKAEYRTDEQNKALAHTDAEIYVLVHQMRSTLGRAEKRVLGGNVYLVTASRRYERMAQALGIPERVTVLPKTLVDLVERITGPILSSVEALRLFENPFMAHAVDATWDDVRCLVQAGVNTVGKRVARLRWDLEQTFHDHLTSAEDRTEKEEPLQPTDDVQSFALLVEAAKSRGYALVPEVERFVSEYEELRARNMATQEEMAALTEKHMRLKEKIDEFGKRKRKYLRRLADE